MTKPVLNLVEWPSASALAPAVALPRPMILLVEPDDSLARSLQSDLAESGYAVKHARTLQDAQAALQNECVNLLIIEPSLPGEDGYNLIRHCRSLQRIGIIIVSSKARTLNKIIGLEMGADDYVPKPYDFDELAARAKAVLRRTVRSAATDAELGLAIAPTSTLMFDDHKFDLGRRELRDKSGTLIDLTSTEIDLLATFVKHPQVPLSRLSIIEHLGKKDDGISLRNIDVLVSKLRRKIEHDGASRIKTVRGAGYIFAPEVQR